MNEYEFMLAMVSIIAISIAGAYGYKLRKIGQNGK